MAVTRIKNNQITDATIVASAKLVDYSVTSGKLANNLTYNSDLTVAGNLTVTGNVTSIDTYDLIVEDPLILLAKDQTGTPSLDIGYIGERGDETNIAWVWDESADEFAAVFTSSTTSNTTITISSYASVHMLDLTAANANITGNVTFSGNIVGNMAITGNVLAGNLNSNAAVTGVTFLASGNITGANVNANSGIYAATANITGNANVGNLGSSGVVIATGNITGGNLITAGLASVTGNITGGNIATAGQIFATGNITGGNLISNALVQGVTANISGNINANNATITNDISTARLTASGNVLAANLNANTNVTGVTITASGNLVGGNANITNGVYSATLNTTGNAHIGGNLIVMGNISYTNVDDLRVEDPVIILGTGPNGAPLTADDGLDRGIYMEYYTTGLGNAFVGWKNATGNMVIANDVEFSGNDVISVNSYGTLEVGNVYAESANIVGNVSFGNISTSGQIFATGNITGGNIISNALVSGTTATMTGNITGGNLLTGGLINAVGNITGANIISNALVSAVTVSATGNISGNNLTITNYANSANFTATGTVTTPNITSTGGLSVTTGSNGNITFDPNGTGNVILNDQTANRMLYTGPNKEVLTNANATYNGSDLVLIGSATIDNVIVNGSDITVNTSALTVNSAGGDIDFIVSGDTTSTLLKVDAGTDTVVVGNGTTTTGAVLKIDSTSSMMMPVGTTGQRPTGVTGMMRFNTSTNSLEFYDASSWVSAGTTFTVVEDDQFNGDGSTVAFTLGQDSTTAATIVSINGVVQIPTVAYSVSGNVLTFTEAPISTDVIDVRSLTISTIVAGIQNTSGNAVIQGSTTSAAMEVTGNLIPTANVTYSLGDSTHLWSSLYVGGNTIYLGNLQLKQADANTFAVYKADGTTQANIDVGSIDVSGITNGTSNIGIPSTNGNATISVGGTGNVLVVTSTGANIAGYATASGNITGGNLITAGLASVTGNVTGGNLVTAGLLSVNSGNSTGTVITNAGGNGVGNIGSASGYFNTIHAKATSALYADLAEKYQADAQYVPGTVVEFGGVNEVTVCDTENSTRVAGVVSTNPSYIMNSGLVGANVVEVALTGRVPCQVVGSVRKGDLMVSAGNGAAKTNNDARAGSIIGKALENFDGEQGVIEVVVGRV